MQLWSEAKEQSTMITECYVLLYFNWNINNRPCAFQDSCSRFIKSFLVKLYIT